MRKQRVLIINIGRKKIISKPWDFEAMCLVDDRKADSKKGVMYCCDAVYYLFEGTYATNDVIEKLSYDRLKSLCEKIQIWYAQDALELLKLQSISASQKEPGKKGLRNIYTLLFKSFGTLPGAVAAQKPSYVFSMLENDDDTTDGIMNMPPDVRSLYGV